MWEYILIFLVALFASLLTFFSGFGLGTLLLPTFLLFFTPFTAVALTAVVHLLNNIFKFILIGRNAKVLVALIFGIPAGIGAYFGAKVLLSLSVESAEGILYQYQLGDHEYEITKIGLTIGILLIIFSLFELLPNLKQKNIPKRWLPVGGLLSGFFGGLSGHQGALRSLFLIKSGLDKKQFVATGVLISFVVDITRISSYFSAGGTFITDNIPAIVTGGIGAFIGAIAGRRLIEKVTLSLIQIIVGVGIMLLGLLILLGIIQ